MPPTAMYSVESTSLMGLAATTTDYAYNNDGQLTQIKTNAQTSKFEYNPIGKLSKVTFPDGASHAYQYDKLGFRKHTKRSDTTAVDYFYDKVGNLKETKKYQAGVAIGHSNKITLNNNNKVMAVTGEGQTPMTIKYTARGNPKTITKDENTTEYQYDNHGRLTSVIDDKTGQVNYAYQKGEEGIRLQLDDRTKGERSNRTQVTAHNQTQAQLQYARMTGSPWQSVIWHESLNKLLVPLPGEINAPDTGFQSTKQRRRLRDAKSTIKRQQLEHDKPSNSQFTPSEYNLVNCSLGDNGEAGGVNQDCFLYGVLLDDASTITVGIPYTFSAFALGASGCEPTYGFAIDGTNIGGSDSGYFTYTFAQSGSHTVQVNANCRQCLGYVKWDAMGINVSKPPAPWGVAINTPGQVYVINRQVQMPAITLEATASPSDIPLSTLTFHWRMTINHSQDGKTTTQVSIPSSGTVNIKGYNKWTPNWGDVVAGGNNVKVYVSVSNESGSVPPTQKGGFKILGENPTAAQIAAEAGIDPWFIVRQIHHESTNRQFSPSPGEPLKNGNGFGLMQVDNPAPSDAALWDWQQNITEGHQVLTLKQASSTIFWNRQITEYTQYNAQFGVVPVAVHADVVVSDITFSHNPTGTQKPFFDGVWMKQYNGASGGNWMAWKNTNLPQGTAPYWQNNPLSTGTPTRPARNYVELVCTQRP